MPVDTRSCRSAAWPFVKDTIPQLFDDVLRTLSDGTVIAEIHARRCDFGVLDFVEMRYCFTSTDHLSTSMQAIRVLTVHAVLFPCDCSNTLKGRSFPLPSGRGTRRL